MRKREANDNRELKKNKKKRKAAEEGGREGGDEAGEERGHLEKGRDGNPIDQAP